MRLIDARRYVLRSRWQEVQPRAREQNAFLKTHSWQEYGAWHLGLTEGAAEETKARHAFVSGDFRRLHRMGLIACHYRPRSGGTRRSSLQHTRSCSTSTERAPDEAAAPCAAIPVEAWGAGGQPASRYPVVPSLLARALARVVAAGGVDG